MLEEGGDGNKVMVVIDESDYSHYALVWALANLRHSITSPLFIFMAQPPSTNCYATAPSLGAASLYFPLSATSELVMPIQEKQHKLTLGLLEKAKSICASHGVNAETFTAAGDPREVICEAVQRYNVNLLVLGQRSNGILQRVFQGSVSEHCVQNADCPILVVKRSK